MSDMSASRSTPISTSTPGSSPSSAVPYYSAAELARLLGQYEPTAEQAAVIQAPLGPALVVAGAGSGKTETMAARVVWLVANGFVRPGEILGLTFTRKAAGELLARVRARLAALPTDLSAGRSGLFDVPEISTYNSFANTLYREHALLIGREPDATVLGEASAWQLAYRVVTSSDDERLGALGKSPSYITQAVLELAHALSDNDVSDPSEVVRYVEEFAGILALEGFRGKSYASVVDAVEKVGALPVLVDLAERYAEEKRRHGLIEFSDQVAFALRVVQRLPRVAGDYRARYRVVLLDEYQDTSVVQSELLARLFSGGAVMAVGDPNQSIYGWRGASASNLAEFPHHFAQSPDDDVPFFSLSASWRNPRLVLDAANIVAAPLREASPIAVAPLAPRPAAELGSVEVVWTEDVLAEASRVAAWFAEHLGLGSGEAEDEAEQNTLEQAGLERDGSGEVKPPTAAMLCRSVKRLGAFIAAMNQAGVPYHVLGVGGLLEEPVVVDLVSALRVLVEPGAGSELIRLLAGAQWRIGVADIRALRVLAGVLEKRDLQQQELEIQVTGYLRESTAEDESASIIDALDWLSDAPADHHWLAGFSADGLSRMRQLGLLLARLRARTSLPLLDFVTHVAAELNLDIEARANELRPRGVGNLDAFSELAAAFVSTEKGSELRAFLAWLDQAESRDRLAPAVEPAEPGTVQILTIHAAKGLEWDLVVIPRLVEDELPGRQRSGTLGWIDFGQLPYDFRGDRLSLPVLPWRSATCQKDIDTELKDDKDDGSDGPGTGAARARGFKSLVRARYLDEQRRLAYVAMTRARRKLLLSGSFWSTQTKSRQASTYLRELEGAGILSTELPEDAEHTENPLEGEFFETVNWPHDPLGGRAEGVKATQKAVETALHTLATEEATDRALRQLLGGTALADEIDRLLLERRVRIAGQLTAAVPIRIPASRFKDYVTDTSRTLSGLQRPMPEKPYRQTRIGTLFHSWVQQRSGVNSASDMVDAGLLDRDDADELSGGSAEITPADAEKLAELKAIFERSRWAGLRPADVEIEVHLPLAGRVVICKLDAVYLLDDGRYQIVDWKTGAVPDENNPADLETRQLQLALYRLAYARWKGLDPDDIDALFYFVAFDRELRPDRIYSEDELARLWFASVGGVGGVDTVDAVGGVGGSDAVGGVDGSDAVGGSGRVNAVDAARSPGGT